MYLALGCNILTWRKWTCDYEIMGIPLTNEVWYVKHQGIHMTHHFPETITLSFSGNLMKLHILKKPRHVATCFVISIKNQRHVTTCFVVSWKTKEWNLIRLTPGNSYDSSFPGNHHTLIFSGNLIKLHILEKPRHVTTCFVISIKKTKTCYNLFCRFLKNQCDWRHRKSPFIQVTPVNKVTGIPSYWGYRKLIVVIFCGWQIHDSYPHHLISGNTDSLILSRREHGQLRHLRSKSDLQWSIQDCKDLHSG